MTDTKRGYGTLHGAQTVVPVIYRSTQNNFETALGANASDTGDWEENDAPGFSIAVGSDVTGTGFVDFSLDAGANFTTFPPRGFSLGPGLPPHSGQKYGRWMRVRYTNGATAQTFFNLQTSYGNFGPLNAPLGGNIAADADAEIIRSISADLDLAFGRIGGQEEDAKFGFVSGLTTSDSGTSIWPYGNTVTTGSARKTFPTTADTLYAVADTGADTGVDITAIYLDATGARLTEAVTLTGATPVRISDTGDSLDCNRGFESGSKAATGNVYLIHGNSVSSAGVPSDPTKVLAVIPAGLGQTEQALETVPIAKRMRMKQGIVTIARASGAAGSAVIRIRTRKSGGTWITKRNWNLSNGNFVKPLAGLVIDPLENIEMRVASVSDAGTNITGEWHYDLVDT